MRIVRWLISTYRNLVPPPVRCYLNLFRLIQYAQAIGWASALKLRRCETGFTRDLLHKNVDALDIKGFDHTLYFRRGTSDLWVIYQVFMTRQYDCLPTSTSELLIIDCGANFGCSAFFFLQRYQGARVIAIEPDPANAELCRRNLAAFGERARVVQAAVWPVKANIQIFDPGTHEWGYQVRPSSSVDCDIESVTIPEILESVGWNHIDLLKIDIEGSEAELFKRATDKWLPKTRTIAIELHGAECSDRFWEALAAYDYNVTSRGEITLCTDIFEKNPKVAVHDPGSSTGAISND